MEDNEQNPKASANPNAPQTKTVKKKKVVVGYGYGNGGYGGYGGYGCGRLRRYGNAPVAGGGAVMPNRTLRDYLMILRERIWYIIVTFFVIFAGILLYTFRMTPMYTSVATVQILRDSDVPIDGPRRRAAKPQRHCFERRRLQHSGQAHGEFRGYLGGAVGASKRTT